MSPWTPDIELSAQLLRAVRLAGQAILAHYQAASDQFQSKADQSPVTQADLAAHHVLTGQLQQWTPHIPVVSEEDESSWTVRTQAPRFWLIDPLDGTKEYLSRNGQFTVNLALIDQHTSVWGCVYAPALDQLYWGSRAQGAFMTQAGQTRPLHLTPPATPLTHCRVVASKSHMDEGTLAFIERLGPSTLVQAGSSLKFCLIAQDQADIYPRLAPTCEWDTAAAHAVLEAAGGRVVDLQGDTLRYGKPEVLNPFFVAARAGVLWS
jgi:3'(2'), 5'-bisphosphate nucleotidase